MRTNDDRDQRRAKTNEQPNRRRTAPEKEGQSDTHHRRFLQRQGEETKTTSLSRVSRRSPRDFKITLATPRAESRASRKGPRPAKLLNFCRLSTKCPPRRQPQRRNMSYTPTRQPIGANTPSSSLSQRPPRWKDYEVRLILKIYITHSTPPPGHLSLTRQSVNSN